MIPDWFKFRKDKASFRKCSRIYTIILVFSNDFVIENCALPEFGMKQWKINRIFQPSQTAASKFVRMDDNGSSACQCRLWSFGWMHSSGWATLNLPISESLLLSKLVAYWILCSEAIVNVAFIFGLRYWNCWHYRLEHRHWRFIVHVGREVVLKVMFSSLTF